MTEAGGTHHLFVVRITQETPEVLRGTVVHASSGHSMMFASLRDLMDFIAFRLGAPLAGVQER